MLVVKCPTCKADVSWQQTSTFRPFCSKRCQLIDLGAWADEGHVISSPVGQVSPAQPTPEQIEEIEAALAANPDAFFKD